MVRIIKRDHCLKVVARCYTGTGTVSLVLEQKWEHWRNYGSHQATSLRSYCLELLRRKIVLTVQRLDLNRKLNSFYKIFYQIYWLLLVA